MASEKALKKMIGAIMDRRRELGIPDWGMVKPEEVIDKLNRQDQARQDAQRANRLADSAGRRHNSRSGGETRSPQSQPVRKASDANRD